MLAQLEATRTAVRPVVEKPFRIKTAVAGLALTAVVLAGCLPTTAPLIGADPADPGAPVAGVGYRSAVAPYTSLRPTAPSSWRQQRDQAPASKSGE